MDQITNDGSEFDVKIVLFVQCGIQARCGGFVVRRMIEVGYLRILIIVEDAVMKMLDRI